MADQANAIVPSKTQNTAPARRQDPNLVHLRRDVDRDHVISLAGVDSLDNRFRLDTGVEGSLVLAIIRAYKRIKNEGLFNSPTIDEVVDAFLNSDENSGDKGVKTSLRRVFATYNAKSGTRVTIPLDPYDIDKNQAALAVLVQKVVERFQDVLTPEERQRHAGLKFTVEFVGLGQREQEETPAAEAPAE